MAKKKLVVEAIPIAPVISENILKTYHVIKKLKGNINNRPFVNDIGDVLELNSFEASILKQYIKED